MTHAEALELLSTLFGCYLVGFFLGYIITVIKQTLEKI